MDDRQNAIGLQVRILNNALHRKREKEDVGSALEGLTPIQRWVIGYLASNQDHDVYQRELESALNIGKSTLTEVLHLMEKNDLVKREAAPEDGRCKRIVLTERSKQIDSEISRKIEQTEERLKQGIAEEDVEIFLRTIKKMIENIAEEKGKNTDSE